MALLYTLDLSGADAATIGADWSNMASVNTLRLRRVGNKLASESAGGTSADYLNTGAIPSLDVAVTFTVDALPLNTGERLEVFLRATNPGDAATLGGYRPRIAKTATGYDYLIQTRNPAGGAIVVLATVSSTLAVGDRIRTSVTGNVVAIERDSGSGFSTVVSWDTAAGPDALRFTNTGAVGLVLNGSLWRLSAVTIDASGPAQPDEYLTEPSTALGVAPSSGVAAWAAGAYVDPLPWGWPYPVAIEQVEIRNPAAPVAATTYETLIELATGPPGSETVIAQVPWTFRNVTGAGYLLGDPADVSLPEPILVPADTRVAVRVADSHSAALTYTGVKIVGREVAAAGGAALTQAVADTLTVADTRELAAGLAVADTAAVADALARDVAAAVADTLGVADTATPAAGKSAAVDDTAGVADTATPATGKGAAIADTLRAADTAGIDLDGATGYMRVPDSASLQIESAGAFSWAFWTRLDSYNNNVLPRFWEKRSSYVCFMGDAANGKYRQVALEFADSAGVAHEYWGRKDLEAGVWTHLAGTYDAASDICRQWVNGVEDTVDEIHPGGAFNGTLQATAGIDLYVGRRRTDLLRNLDGQIDDLRLWGRALTPTEIGDTFAGSPPASGLAGRWDFERPGDATDSSGNGNHGILTSAPAVTVTPTLDVATALADTLVVADARASAPEKALADTAGVADTATPGGGLVQAIDDVAAVADALARDVAAAVADTLGVADSAAPAGAGGLTLADTLAVADTLLTAAGRLLTIPDTLTVADLPALAAALALADTAGVADTVAPELAVARLLADTAGVADLLTTEGGKGAALADTLTVADARALAAAVAIADTAAVADTVGSSGSGAIVLTDTLPLADTAALAVALVLADTAAVADTASGQTFKGATLADTLVVADTLTRDVLRGATLADTLGVADGLTFAVAVTVTDTLGLLDRLSVLGSSVPTRPGHIVAVRVGRVDRAAAGHLAAGRPGTVVPWT